MEFCTPEEFENKICIISNSLQKIQWMNNFHLFGDYYLSHVCPFSNEKGEVFLMSQSMAFGDGGNDIPMLQHVGVSVAMGNAEQKVKEVADYITTSVDDDGVLQALKHFNVL